MSDTDDGSSSSSSNSTVTVASSWPSYVAEAVDETSLERSLDVFLGVAFLVTALVAARRMSTSRQQQAQQQQQSGGGASETTVVTAFYSLILLTSVFRALWFLIPSTVWKPSYVPTAVYAWDRDHPSWKGSALSEIVVTAGSLSLFSIFILILVYWADILKKYFHPGSRRSLPMVTFLTLVSVLVGLEAVNLLLFLCKIYTTEGMILYHAVLLASVSLVCVVEISIFSHRFRTVLRTLGEINQVSTDSQVRRIVWITVTGNVFFCLRAALETAFCVTLLGYWHKHGSVAKVFTHTWWDVYTLFKYGAEVTILSLMLYILQSRFRSAASNAVQERTAGGAYQKVPNAQVV